jgi:multidrug efflux pump subunit AcrA (membrane-fusion protein)
MDTTMNTLTKRLAVTLLAAAAAAATTACGSHEEKPAAAQSPLAVTVAAAATVEQLDRVDVGGTVRARTIAVLSSRIVAPIVEVRVSPGDRVRTGQVLVRLDDRELEASRARADAGVAAATSTIAAAAADADAAAAALTLATASHKRIAGLRERNSATAGELDEAVAALRSAEARAAAASARQTEASRALDAARASLQAASVATSYAALVAPFDGVVSVRNAEPGGLAAPGSPLLTVEDDRSFRLEASIDASRVPALQPGTKVPVSIEGGAGQPLEGVIAEIGRSIDPSVHSTLLKIDLPRHDWLRSGMFGRAQLPGETRRALAVPASAIRQRGQLSVVFVESDGVARMRLVHQGRTRDGRVEILAGLVEGDRVVLDPPADLADGRSITASAADAARRVP